MEDATEPALINELLSECDGRYAAIIVPYHVWHAGLFDRLYHFNAFGAVHRKWFLTKNHLARLRGGDGDVFVHVVGAGDVNQVNIIPGDQLAPIGFAGFIAPPLREGLQLGLVPATDGFK